MDSKEPIFNKDEISENDRKKKKLFDLITSGDSILMVGSGCSASIYPDWPKFVKLLEDAAVGINQHFVKYDRATENFLDFAGRVKKCITPDIYYNLIHREFKPKNAPSPTHEKYHEALCNLLINGKFRGITTTNYDVILESALGAVLKRWSDYSVYISKDVEPAVIFEFLYSLNDKGSPKKILHIHGVHDKRDSIILCQEEYMLKYGFQLSQPATTMYQAIMEGSVKEDEFETLLYQHGMMWPQHRKILWSLLATRRMVFMGFSMNDPYFQKMLSYVGQDLHPFGYDTHYLILRITKSTKEYALTFARDIKEKHGVETVFYEDEEDDYSGMEIFINEIEKAVSPPQQTVLVENNNAIVNENPIQEDNTDYLLQVSRERSENEDQ